MKNIINNILIWIFIPFLIISCSAEDINHPSEGGIPLAAEYEDAIQIDVDQETNTVTFSFNRKDVVPFWTVYTTPNTTYSSKSDFELVFPKAGDYRVEVKVLNANGQSDGTITKTIMINRSLMNGFGGFVYDSPYNIWKTATIGDPVFWYAPNWSQIADPAYTLNDGVYTVNLPEATTDTWQSQMSLGTNFGSSAGTQYDFSVIFTSTKDHPHVMVKLVDSSDDNVFYFAQTMGLKANEPACFWKSAMEGIDIANLKLVLDFGGNAAETVIMIENIVFKDHANDDGTVVPDDELTPEPNWADVNSVENLWYGKSFTQSFHYAPNWVKIADPTLTVDGTEYSINFPSATFDQWQNQVHLTPTSLATTSTENYDFRVTLTASKDVNGATIKLVQVGGTEEDDAIFIFTERFDLKAGQDIVAKVINVEGVDIPHAKLVFDFGGNPDNTTVVIKDVILQIHRD